MAQPKQQGIDISQLSLEQLNTFKQQFEEEVQVLSNSWQQLKLASARFTDSKDALSAIKTENEGKAMLVPLTTSLFVPGQLTNTEQVLIDIGTGYYVTKPVKQASDFFDRKIKMINDNADQVAQAVSVKRKNLESVLLVMQQKIGQMQGQAEKE
ncbi:prefoldin subunit 5 [Planoprotostelium fungivorum]|uniref:Prefoldin subunit 5 n=1 Tax=Planoprotostelium fungivorum TaxID=1890364 RepID=A0A2P6NP58_9EUKA|nr:prefoldin subunit 5 [Planoprotostelium fungivorum]